MSRRVQCQGCLGLAGSRLIGINGVVFLHAAWWIVAFQRISGKGCVYGLCLCMTLCIWVAVLDVSAFITVPVD